MSEFCLWPVQAMRRKNQSTQTFFSDLFQYKHAELCRKAVKNVLKFFKGLEPVEQKFGK